MAPPRLVGGGIDDPLTTKQDTCERRNARVCTTGVSFDLKLSDSARRLCSLEAMPQNVTCVPPRLAYHGAMSRAAGRVLIGAAIIAVWQPPIQPPPRWWRSPQALTSMHLTPADCDEVDRAVQSSVKAQTQASMELADAIHEIAVQLDDAFAERRLLELSERLAAAEAQEAALDHEIAPERRQSSRGGIHQSDRASTAERDGECREIWISGCP